MFGRKKSQDQGRTAEPSGAAANGRDRAAPNFGNAGSLNLRKPLPAKPLPGRSPDIPRAGSRDPLGALTRRADPLHGTALAQDHKILHVARDIAISGKIGACERLTVEGQLDAAVGDCRELDVAKGASFIGSIRVEDADIAGLFEGEMTVRRRLRIHATGRLRGRILYGHIEIEPGGQIDGEVARLQPVVPHAAQPAATAPDEAAEAVSETNDGDARRA